MQCLGHSRLRIIAAGVISREGGYAGDSIPKASVILESDICESILDYREFLSARRCILRIGPGPLEFR